jgi:biopolymer transport protein ExbD
MLLDKRRTREPNIPTSSMADIAFLLLIFFLVTTSLDLDKGLQLRLPEKGGEMEVSKRLITNIWINASGQVLLDDEEIEIPMIKDAIKMKLAQQPLLTVSIKTDSKTKYQDYISVLDQVQMAEATRISVAEPES